MRENNEEIESNSINSLTEDNQSLLKENTVSTDVTEESNNQDTTHLDADVNSETSQAQNSLDDQNQELTQAVLTPIDNNFPDEEASLATEVSSVSIENEYTQQYLKWQNYLKCFILFA